MRLRDKLFSNYYKHHQRHEVVEPDWNHVKTVALLHERNVDIHEIITRLHSLGKEVTVFDPPKSQETWRLLERPKGEILQIVSLHHFDLLIDLSLNPPLPIQYMASRINADFKVGSTHTRFPYDLAINMPEGATVDFFFAQIEKYIPMFFTPHNEDTTRTWNRVDYSLQGR